MKKYFLLATTALLLGTSNVMAAFDGETNTVDVNVSVNIKPAGTVKKESDLDLGTFYVNYDTSTTGGSKLATFNNSITVSDDEDVVDHDGTYTAAVVTFSYMEGAEYKPAIKNLVNGVLPLNGGIVELKNLSFEPTSEDNYILSGELYASESGYGIQLTGTHTGVITVGVDY